MKQPKEFYHLQLTMHTQLHFIIIIIIFFKQQHFVQQEWQSFDVEHTLGAVGRTSQTPFLSV